MWPWKRTPKPSETSQLCQAITDLAKELRAQSQSQRELSARLLDLVSEKDAQIKVVLESKFQHYVTAFPPRIEKPAEPENIEHLADVSEVSEQAAEDAMITSTTKSNQATTELEKQLRDDFLELAQEHAEHAGARGTIA